MTAAGGRYMERCPVGCAAPLLPSAIILPEGPLLRCAGCGQLISQCSEAQYIAALAKWDTAAGTRPDARSERRHEFLSRLRLATLLRVLGRPAPGARLLDVGCSSGAFLAAAARMGFEAEGVEPSPEAAESARRAGFRVHTGLLEQARYPAAAFDAVTLIEVLEHLRDPRPLLAECRRILRPGGIVMATTPNAASWTARAMGARWEVFSLTAMGGHVSFFNPVSLRLLAARTGFELARLETRNVRLAEKGQFPAPIYLLAKLGSGLLDAPARLAGAGHDFTAFLRAGAGAVANC
ncbi:MAG TPA: class I SAM-dependent methyltransferase [Burkholderiales bacterium]|nr:class I SAM-dependent methyltransferase [Burkholderiales bacterium]